MKFTQITFLQTSYFYYENRWVKRTVAKSGDQRARDITTNEEFLKTIKSRKPTEALKALFVHQGIKVKSTE